MFSSGAAVVARALGSRSLSLSHLEWLWVSRRRVRESPGRVLLQLLQRQDKTHVNNRYTSQRAYIIKKKKTTQIIM